MSGRKWSKFMLLFAILTGLPSCIQATQILVTGEVAGVSIIAFALHLLIDIVWAAHGYKIKDRPLMIASTVGIIGALTTIISVIVL